MSTIFLLHEVEVGMNPEVHTGLYERLYKPTVAQSILASRISSAIGEI